MTIHILQNFDFLSLSTGGSGLKVNNNYNKVGNRLEPLSKLQVPYLQWLEQQHGLMPFPMPQSQYASTYRDQISVPGPQVLFCVTCRTTITIRYLSNLELYD